jgi:hypothetical protein
MMRCQEVSIQHLHLHDPSISDSLSLLLHMLGLINEREVCLYT